ncbi:gamma-glutamyltransferase family protein [Acetobacteraceae bacterium ESL0709]|nr:gamma-glutamyltransferase family protein [Acetobacteraceae bacterium ESL0697]MDF7678915.1 gamma-glutamyltransferase family protein [Acetobacteraceae bacterium ESL0709]
MLHSFQSGRGMVTSPHHLASQSGLDILRRGGTALEAVVAMAATLSVVYPHMTGLGGDAFWLISLPNRKVEVIEACGAAARHLTAKDYIRAGHNVIPWRGAWATNTMAGAVSGWQAALRHSAALQKPLPLQLLLEQAVWYAENGYPLTESEARLLSLKREELLAQPCFKAAYETGGVLPVQGEFRKNPALADTLKLLIREGLESFYTKTLRDRILADLASVGSPLSADDFRHHKVAMPLPLHARALGATLYNTAPPTQGVASLAILKLFEKLPWVEVNGAEYIHALVEATKYAFRFRNEHVGDPRWMTQDAQAFLDDDGLFNSMAGKINPSRAMPWGEPSQQGDTTWMGAIDSQGMGVSMIQSLYFEFGSGIFLPETGILWQNRGSSFQLEEGSWNHYQPGRKPFHTLNPALAHFDDGRVMVYGTMGGEGQPQTQAALFTRYACYHQSLQQAITAPRWLLGRTWGSHSTSLKLESRFDPAIIQALERAGHIVDVVGPYEDMMGHAGAIVHDQRGLFEGASDPRSDGCVAAF